MSFHVRRMRQDEITTLEQLYKRDAQGALCRYAVEGERGTHVTGLSRQQAHELVERMSEPVAA